MIRRAQRMKSRQQGLTLLETMLALALGIVIIMSVIVFYPTVRNNARMTETTKLVGSIGDALRTYAQSPDYAPGKNGVISLAKLQAAGLLTEQETMTPWVGGQLSVRASGNYFVIGFTNIPASVDNSNPGQPVMGGVCKSLAQSLSNALVLPSPGTVKAYGRSFTIDSAETCLNITGTGKTIPLICQAARCVLSGKDGTTGTLLVFMDLS